LKKEKIIEKLSKLKENLEI